MLLDEIGDYLSTQGIGTIGTDLFKGYLPDAPADAVCLYETGGMAPVRAMTQTVGQVVEERPALQVVARSASYPAARLKATAATALLDGLGDVILGGTRYLWVTAKQAPFAMGRDAQNRVMVAVNFDVCKARSTS